MDIISATSSDGSGRSEPPGPYLQASQINAFLVLKGYLPSHVTKENLYEFTMKRSDQDSPY